MAQGQERRRYARIPMSLEALISISGRPPIACTVKDFCVAGMFIQTDERQLRFINMHDKATLYFALVVGGERKDLQLKRAEAAKMRIGLEMQSEKNSGLYRAHKREIARMTMVLAELEKNTTLVKAPAKVAATETPVKASQSSKKSVKGTGSKKKKSA